MVALDMVMDEHSKIMVGDKQYIKDDDWQLIARLIEAFFGF